MTDYNANLEKFIPFQLILLILLFSRYCHFILYPGDINNPHSNYIFYNKKEVNKIFNQFGRIIHCSLCWIHEFFYQ